jgi:hypothetical protein
MLVNLGNDLWVRARNILGFGPVTMLTLEQRPDAQCAVLLEWAGWVPCLYESRDVMSKVYGGK